MAGERSRARGELEAQVLRVLWAAEEPLSGAEIQAVLPKPQPAYTTVLTVLDRLSVKGEVVRSGDSVRRQRFSAARSEQRFTSEAMLAALSGSGDRQGALLRFAGDLDEEDAALLRRALGES